MAIRKHCVDTRLEHGEIAVPTYMYGPTAITTSKILHECSIASVTILYSCKIFDHVNKTEPFMNCAQKLKNTM